MSGKGPVFDLLSCEAGHVVISNPSLPIRHPKLWEEEPLVPPADVDGPAEGAENVSMERRPVQELLLVPCGSGVGYASSE